MTYYIRDTITDDQPTDLSQSETTREQIQVKLEDYDLEYATVPSFSLRETSVLLTIRTPETGWNGRTLKETLTEGLRPSKERTYTAFDVCLSFTGVQAAHEPTLQQAMQRGLFDCATGEWVQGVYEELDAFAFVTTAHGDRVRLCINNTDLEFGFSDCILRLTGSRQARVP